MRHRCPRPSRQALLMRYRLCWESVPALHHPRQRPFNAARRRYSPPAALRFDFPALCGYGIAPAGSLCYHRDRRWRSIRAMYAGCVTASCGCCAIFHFYVFLPHEYGVLPRIAFRGRLWYACLESRGSLRGYVGCVTANCRSGQSPHRSLFVDTYGK